MITVDGDVIRTQEKINARKSQRIVITMLDEEIQSDNSNKRINTAASLAKYVYPDFTPMEDGAWERTVKNAKENT